MYTPDRVICRKIREYDSKLFVEWNNQKGYFELWREMVWGRRLITPVTESIYKPHGKKVYTPLDERLLVWIFHADSWRTKTRMDHIKMGEDRWKEQIINQRKKQTEDFRHMAAESYHAINNFHFSRYQSKNKNPTQALAKRGRKKLHTGNWVKPDLQSKTAKRTFARSTMNAIHYFGGKA